MKRGVKCKLSPQKAGNAGTLYRFGWKPLAIAWHYHVDINTVIRTLKRLGVYVPRRVHG